MWGLYFAVLLVIEKVFLLKYLDKSKAISRFYTLFAVLISFVIFNATDMGEAFSYVKGMLFLGGAPVISTEFLYYARSYGVILLLGVIGATPIVKKLAVIFSEGEKTSKIFDVLRPVVLVSLLVVTTAYLVGGSFNPFLYFRF